MKMTACAVDFPICVRPWCDLAAKNALLQPRPASECEASDRIVVVQTNSRDVGKDSSAAQLAGSAIRTD